MAQKSLEGRVAVVAGASRSIGMGAAVELAAAGAYVYALGRTLAPTDGRPNRSLSETAQQMEALGGQGAAVVCDCTDDAALATLFARVQAEHGRLDVLVNSVFAAPRFGPTLGKRFWETEPALWHDVVTLGAGSVYLASRRAAPMLMETAKAAGRPGLIVNVSGRGAVRYRYNVVYGVGKSATERLTRDMAIELKDHNVAAVSIWPNGYTGDPEKPETPRYNGRAIVALAADPGLMEKSGDHFWTATLGREYGFTDEFGHQHPIGDLTDSHSLEHEAN